MCDSKRISNIAITVNVSNSKGLPSLCWLSFFRLILLVLLINAIHSDAYGDCTILISDRLRAVCYGVISNPWWVHS